MNLTNETLAVMLAEPIQIAANCATALHEAGTLPPRRATDIAHSLRILAGILDAYSGEGLPVPLAPLLVAQANLLEAPGGHH